MNWLREFFDIISEHWFLSIICVSVFTNWLRICFCHNIIYIDREKKDTKTE